MRLKLRDKYLFVFVALLLFMVLVLSSALLYQFKSSFTTLSEASSRAMSADLLLQIRQRGEVITRFLGETLVNPLYLYNMAEIYELLNTTKQQQDILYTYVFDAQGKILHDGTKDILKFGMPINAGVASFSQSFQDKLLVKTYDDTMEVAMPIWMADKQLGGILVGLSLKGIQADIAKMESRLDQIKHSSLRRTVVSLLVTTIVLSLIGICISIFWAGRLIRPIKELGDYAHQVGKGNYDFDLINKYDDEIGELIDAFDRMKSDLQARTVSIDDLEKRINERTRDLTKLNEQLKKEIKDRQLAEKEREAIRIRLQRAEKMEAVGTLAGGVAHDLNNILAGVVGYPEILLVDMEEDDPLREPIETIFDSGKKAAQIVEDLLTMARRGVLVNEVVNLADILEAYLHSGEFEKMMSYHPGVSIEKNVAPELLRMVGSPVHLSKTIMNLVSNAAEAMPQGGTIRITLENRSVESPLSGYENVAPGDYVVLSVADTGIGISTKDLEHIFEPFYTKKVMGRSETGLGMAVVWGTVKDHSGYIGVDSGVGQGTQFDLYFPGTRQEIGTVKTSISIDAYMGTETILVVDDVKNQRLIAYAILKRLGYAVEAVSSGEEAVEYIRLKPVDLVILDMIMSPGIDGLETYKQMLSINPEQKAIIASGYSETERVKAAQKLGVGAYIKKPYMLESIGTAIRAELDRDQSISPNPKKI